MKVSKLINELKEFNPDADVRLEDGEDICISYISKNGKKHTEQVFIERDSLCETCFFHDGGGYCTAYDKRTEDVEECFNYLEE